MSSPSLLSPPVLLLLALLVGGVSLAVRSRPGVRRRTLDRFASRVALPVPEARRADLEGRLRDRHVAADLGLAVGLALVALWGFSGGTALVTETFWHLIAAGGALTGVAVGAGIAALRDAGRPRRDRGARVARPTALTLDDYVAPCELWGGRIVAVLPFVLVAAASVTGAAAATGGVLVVAGLGVAALIAAEVGGRRVLDAPQAAGSDLELAWSDAMRARVLRDVATVPITVGGYATAGVLASLDLRGLDPSALAGPAVAALLAVVGVGVAALVGWSASPRPHRHFRRRLWPRLDVAGPTAGGGRR